MFQKYTIFLSLLPASEAKVDFVVETPTSGGTAEEDSVEEKLHYDRNKCFFDGVSGDLKPR